jgi:acyl-CoA thioesterase-1
VLLIQLALACSPSTPWPKGSAETNSAAAESTADAVDTRLVVAFGDSLFAGYHLEQGQGFAPALERSLTARGIKTRVVNAAVTGDTSAAGLQRLAFTLDGFPRKPDLVIVALGANDMLRGLNPETTRTNLDAILAELKKRGIPTMLAGMLAAPNMGQDYAMAFDPIYPALAKKYDVPLYPFLLNGVIGHPDLLLQDGMHPNPKGVDAIVRGVVPVVAEKLEK